MTDHMQPRRSADLTDLEAEGLPDLEGQPEGVEDVVEGLNPARDYPQGVEDRVTAAEQLGDEPLAERVWREEPGSEPVEEEALGRLVQPAQGVDGLDDEPTEMAEALGSDADALSAEEAAVHLTDNP